MTTPPAECGTVPGWRRHNRTGTQPCMPCKVAHDTWNQDRQLAPWRRRVLLAALAGYDLYPTGGKHENPTPAA